MPLDLESLATLEAVVAEGGIARAAQRLHKVPSAVSYQVSKLEQYLQTPLLNREGYRVKLTPTGEIILSEGAESPGPGQRDRGPREAVREGWEARLQLIVDGIVPLDAVLSALKELAAQGAPTRVQVQGRIPARGAAPLRDGRGGSDDREGLQGLGRAGERAARRDRLHPVRRLLSPLARRKNATLAELQQHTEVTVQDSSESGNDAHMFGSERVFFLEGFHAKKQALMMGLGYGWMPSYLIHDEMKTGVWWR
jgi:DNA-binding transcriptional LysR family regulator